MKKIAEWADRLSSSPGFLVTFNLALVVLWLTFGTDLANIFISIITAEMVLLAAGAARRGNLAIHAKLDELICAIPEARDDLQHLEDEVENKIKEVRR